MKVSGEEIGDFAHRGGRSRSFTDCGGEVKGQCWGDKDGWQARYSTTTQTQKIEQILGVLRTVEEAQKVNAGERMMDGQQWRTLEQRLQGFGCFQSVFASF
ncbi:hypothetical protein AAHE18_09G056100 [Arachis hypogaea]